MSSTTPGFPSRGRSRFALAGLIGGLVAGTGVVVPAAPAPATPVIVTGAGSADELVDAVERHGGEVTGTLRTLDAVVAVVPADRLDALRTEPSVLAVSPDRPVVVTADDDEDDDDLVPPGYDPTTDPGSLHHVARQVRAHELWAQGITGRGVDIAVLDTGVSSVPRALEPGRKVVHGPAFNTLSSPIPTIDGNGHGTHVASIAAGATAGPEVPAATRFSPLHVNGIAPDARIVPVKVAEETGTTTLSQVMLGIDWVIANRTTEGRNIRVLNLSIAATPGLTPAEDPLAHGAVAAWNAGIVVVASAGNSGQGTPLASPAYEPRILSVGALDHRGTIGVGDDVVASFTAGTSSGRTRPDLFAPGRSVFAALAPSSTAAGSPTKAGSGSDREYVRGSGTSQAAAVVSGAAALLLSQRPTLTPDQVAALLLAGAQPVGGVPAARVDLVRSAAAPTPAATTTSAITTASTQSASGQIGFARRGATWSTDAWARRGATWSGGFAARSWS